MVAITTLSGQEVYVADETIALVAGPYPHDVGPHTYVYGPTAGALITGEAPELFVRRLQNKADFAVVTRPNGSPAWVHAKAVSAVRAPLSTEALEPGEGLVNAVLVIGKLHQSVQEQVSAAIELLTEQGRKWDFDYCVSYAWGDDTPEGKKREDYVDQLCKDAARLGRRILRDKTAMGVGDRISEFMHRLAKGKRVFIILSDKYLRSPNCTHELYEVWQNSRKDDKEFLRRVRVFKLPEVKISTLAEQKVYYDWWQQQLAEQKVSIADLAVKGHLPPRYYDDFQATSRFAGDVLEILSLVSDTLRPATWEDFLRHGFSDP
jgi:hypothetical protein